MPYISKFKEMKMSLREADKKYKERRNNCHRLVKTTYKTIEYIKNKIELHWSSDQIVNRYEKDKLKDFPSLSTIYRWIHLGYIPKTNIEPLRRKGKFKRPAETREKFNIGKTIKKRPKEVYKRNTFGHWEADTVVSGALIEHIKANIALFRWRKENQACT